MKLRKKQSFTSMKVVLLMIHPGLMVTQPEGSVVMEKKIGMLEVG